MPYQHAKSMFCCLELIKTEESQDVSVRMGSLCKGRSGSLKKQRHTLVLRSAPARISSATLGASFSCAAIKSSRSTGAKPSAGSNV